MKSETTPRNIAASRPWKITLRETSPHLVSLGSIDGLRYWPHGQCTKRGGSKPEIGENRGLAIARNENAMILPGAELALGQ
jgi:hypothetical protein